MIPRFIWTAKEHWRSFVTVLDILARDRLRCVGWGQVVFAPLMMSLSFSVGVCPFKTMRGRRLRRSWMA